MPVFINKMKNEQNIEERYTEIERENRLLFEKITQIHLKGAGGISKQNSLHIDSSKKQLSTIATHTSSSKGAET